MGALQSNEQSEEISKVINHITNDILNNINREREREIIVRRFGLYKQKETLDKIGKLLNITRERVRQLEKATINNLRNIAKNNRSTDFIKLEKQIVKILSESGRVSRIEDLANKIYARDTTESEQTKLIFIAEISPILTVINESNKYYHAVGISEYGDEKKFRSFVDVIVKTIQSNGKPIQTEELHNLLNFEHPDHVRALASISKRLASFKDVWGLISWPTINPKNIRDKIYVILAENGKPLHFNEIAEAIKDSDFSRKDVTTQAVHNELIKDDRFVLIGRGIYALDSWGYSQGSLTDIIESVLKNAAGPMHQDEIVKNVLKSRSVKEGTILIHLQNKPQFKRVAKATYILAPQENQK